MIEDEEGLDPETARIARTGLVRLYYRREFDRQAMDEQLSAIAEKAPSTDELVAETRNWAQQRAFQLGAHMLRGAVEPREAARPLSDILDTLSGPDSRRRPAGLRRPPRSNARRFAGLGGPGRARAPGVRHRRSRSASCSFTTAPPVGTASPDDVQAWHTSLLQRFVRVFGELSPGAMLYKPIPALAGVKDTPTRPIPGAPSKSTSRNAPSTADLRTLVHARVVSAERCSWRTI